MRLLKNLPDRKKNRLKGYNYHLPGWYFVTICTQHMWEYFGKIQKGYLCVNDLGAVVAQQWQWLETQYVDVSLDAWCVMPNHFHGIIGIGMDDVGYRWGFGRTGDDSNYFNRVGTGHDLSVQQSKNDLSLRGILQSGKSLSEMVGAFKATTSKIIRRHHCSDFRWQRSFHDRIIRNEKEMVRIRQYIFENPRVWYRDRNRH